MSRIVLLTGPTGVGKTTHAPELATSMPAVRFSIDPWMQTLFADDMTALDYSWMIERVHRCYAQIRDVVEQIVAIGGNVVLDLGFTERAQRAVFADHARALGVEPEVHYLDAPIAVRRDRIARRNAEKDPRVYAFEVTGQMLDFMEPRFEPPDDVELRGGRRIDAGDS